MVNQFEFVLPIFDRGYHIIDDFVLKGCGKLPEMGMLHLFIKHTSAALTINESYDPTVRIDFESILDKIVPENLAFLKHTTEGIDDMPAHIKTALIGNSIMIPITNGRLNLGMWQGIYLCEFRNQASARHLVATIY